MHPGVEILSLLSANRKLRLRTRGDVRKNLSRTTPNGRELNVKRLGPRTMRYSTTETWFGRVEDE